jgi:hypothetical protein
MVMQPVSYLAKTLVVAMVITVELKIPELPVIVGEMMATAAMMAMMVVHVRRELLGKST